MRFDLLLKHAHLSSLKGLFLLHQSVDQVIYVCEGAYRGVTAKILKVDRRNMRMQVEIPFASRSVKTWVEYEIVKEAEG